MIGVGVTPLSWRIGDVVAPLGASTHNTVKKTSTATLIGRVVSETPNPSSSLSLRNRQSGTVAIEFVGRSFASAMGIKPPSSHSALETRRVRTSKLVHSSEIQLMCTNELYISSDEENQTGSHPRACKGHVSSMPTIPGSSYLASSVNEKVLSDIAATSRFERNAIDSLKKECKKSAEALACVFSAGLPDAIMAAIKIAERQMNCLESQEDLPDKLTSIGDLVNGMTGQLFGERKEEPDGMDVDSPISSPEPVSARRSHAPITYVGDRRRARESTEEQLESGSLLELDEQAIPLDQRTNMLLSLMSRANHRSGPGSFLNDFAQAGIESMGNLPRNGRQPFVFGSSNGLPDFNPQALLDRDGQQSGREHVSESEERSSSMPISDDVHVTIEHASSSFLDSVLRRHCYLSHVQTGSNKQNAVEYAVCVRRLANDAILLDSVDWVVAIVDMHIKKGQLGSSQRSSAILRNLADEEGSSLLSLAICFGCSASLINRLIGWGATVNEEAIQKAAMTDQPMTLSLLLQHSAFKEGVINQDLCSEAVRRVLAETKSRQSELDKQMRENIGEFLVQLLEQIFKLGLMSRRLNASRVDMCSKVICEILVGNVLLRALQWDQSCCPSDRGVDQMLVDTCSKEKADIESSLVPSGLLGSLPCSVVEDFLFAKKSNVTTFLLLCEDYLCSKDMSDISAGLEFLSVLLTKFPQLRSSFEMKRFGMAEFVSNHNVLASNRIADILSKQLTIGLDVSVNRPNAGDIPPEQTPNMTGGAVLCPKKHAAALHITKHSSFRCDICGCAVPKGEYIFGCRQCDYDECLHCTLRDEKRTLFVQMMIRGVSSNCSRILALTNDVDEIGDLDDDDVVKSSAKDHELQALSVRLLRRNVDALKELGILLDESGRISIHEFISIVLPSLHASLIGTSHGCDESVNIGSTHRNKKARAARFSSIDSSDARLEYCREALRCMIADQDDVVKSVDGLHENEAGKEMDDNPNTADEGEKVNISYSPIVSEFLRRLHQVLSFYEGVQVLSTSVEKLGGLNSTANAGDLQALTKPIELQLSPSEFNNSGAHVRQSVIFAEPLIPFADLQRHILRTYRIFDPLYLSHCKRYVKRTLLYNVWIPLTSDDSSLFLSIFLRFSLASDSAIIVERSICKHTMPWRFATVVGFDEKTGAHAVRYASAWKRGQERQSLHITEGSKGDLSCLRFYGVETALVLAARQYYIIFRKASPSSPDEMIDAKHSSDEPAEIESDVNDDLNSLSEAFGTRVESNCGTNSSWTVLTLVGSDSANSSVDRTRYVLVSDDGELFSNVAADQVRAQRSLARDDISLSRRPVRGIGEDRHSLFPFFATARYLAESDSVSFSRNKSKSLKRSWSALALVEDMRPVDLKLSRDTKSFTRGVSSSPNLVLRCRVDESEFQCVVDAAAFQRPPQLNVQFSAHEKLPGMTLAYSPEKTLVYALKELNHKQNKWSELLPKPRCNLFFSVKAELIEPINTAEPDTLVTKEPDRDPTTNGSIVCENRSWPLRRSRKLSARSLSNEDEDDFSAVPVLCEGVDEICVQCMEVISLISECADDPVTQRENDVLNLPGFANPTLTNKLTEQLDDVLCVVGAALPEWCISAPSFAPRVFSYESRRLLMERAAFGPSRSTLKQQEVKVNVGRLRQRMASLRARAVELVGEAFAGGAEDPTALQLQADELYGMEEALASRVRAAFRAAKWHEHSLQVAKAAVRRERLLADAAAVMESYSVDSSVCRRRLEVRFEGESGFDAASGDEAGVTRGFYADVAEALVSAENVAGVYCPSPCGSTAVADAAAATKVPPSDIKETEDEWKALPFWIPDMDSSSLVIIPSPRADKKSGIGLFPRPIPHYHPQFEDVITQFRFMGRLFAAAMRDGFMFPLPLSCSFLKLVLMESDSASKKDSYNVPLLRSSDLPRPGFLGGEVYATDHYICGALERLNSSDPPLSRHELKRRYEEIATDKNFARVAFGRTYDCSFEEYFQDRTFVDPLDPAQDANAVPLCPKGHLKSVNIFNVRDWVAAAKSFMLHDGVIHQALAFRRGINDFFSVDYLRVFTPEELQRDVCGLGDDVENWSESSIRKLFKLDGTLYMVFF